MLPELATPASFHCEKQKDSGVNVMALSCGPLLINVTVCEGDFVNTSYRRGQCNVSQSVDFYQRNLSLILFVLNQVSVFLYNVLTNVLNLHYKCDVSP